MASNRRTLRFLAGWAAEVPAWKRVEDADLGEAFGGGATRHRVLRLEAFLRTVGSLPVHVAVDGPMSRLSIAAFETTIRRRESGHTTVLGRPGWLAGATLPTHVQRVAVLEPGEDSEELASADADAVAMPARAWAAFGRVRVPAVALGCDTRAAVAAAKGVGAIVVHTERPAWLRAAWMDDPFARTY